MPQWLEILVATAAVIGPAAAAYIGVQVGLAVAKSQIADLRDEVKILRQAKHDQAGVLTRHSLRLHLLDEQDEE